MINIHSFFFVCLGSSFIYSLAIFAVPRHPTRVLFVEHHRIAVWLRTETSKRMSTCELSFEVSIAVLTNKLVFISCFQLCIRYFYLCALKEAVCLERIDLMPIVRRHDLVSFFFHSISYFTNTLLVLTFSFRMGYFAFFSFFLSLLHTVVLETQN